MRKLRVWRRYLRMCVFVTRSVWKVAERYQLAGWALAASGCLSAVVAFAIRGQAITAGIWTFTFCLSCLNVRMVWKRAASLHQDVLWSEARLRLLRRHTWFIVPDKTSLPLPRRSSDDRIIGYRLWQLNCDDRGPVLASCSTIYFWDGPTVRNPEPPDERESYFGMAAARRSPGFYAYSTPEDANEHAAVTNAALAKYGTTTVVGTVQLFGTVVRHERGYRAQAAIVRSLIVTAKLASNAPEVVRVLERRYGCPVIASADPANSLLEVWHGEYR